MSITPGKNTAILKRIYDRIQYLYKEDTIVRDAHDILANIINQSTSSPVEYAINLSILLPPSKLFNAQLVKSEGVFPSIEKKSLLLPVLR